MMSAPLVLGNDVRHMTPETLSLLTDKEVIAIDQDILGAQGLPAKKDSKTEVWTKKLADGSTAVALFNRGEETTLISGTWTDIKVTGQTVRDLWAHSDHHADEGYSYAVPKHGAVLLRVK